MDSLRRTALVAGVLYLLTSVSIPTLALYGPVHDELHPRLWPGHSRRLRRHPGGHRGRRRHRHRCCAIPGAQEAEPRGHAGSCRLASPGSRRHPSRRRMPPVDRELAAGQERGTGALAASRAWCHGFFPGWHSSERHCSSLPGSACCSAFGNKGPRCRRSPHSRSRYLSSRWASISSSRASDHHPLPQKSSRPTAHLHASSSPAS